ncbi:hypothetical protein DFQ27_009686 [Actinomortierella ambigua]|uniref:Uncharacterized protein n=1 Tax=Actinomortierella ambigua TaxID=1343610 RepID=A0A9P6TWB3_9FUNG|nr:hypothetical protein DFQ27_009686 [Actinomortierella ambigua]
MVSLTSGPGTHAIISSPQAIYQRTVAKRARATTEESGIAFSSFDSEHADPRASAGVGLGIAASSHSNHMAVTIRPMLLDGHLEIGPEPKRRRGDPTEGGWAHPGLATVATGGDGATTVLAAADLEDENAMELS